MIASMVNKISLIAHTVSAGIPSDESLLQIFQNHPSVNSPAKSTQPTNQESWIG